ncbi:MAG: 6-carboxytetrahydropterin synthase [Bacteroidales bacterium]|nr:6-carboxytetrahydropterin synthase [Bacteroidales bacterium]
MNKIRITKQFTFEMAHALKDYDGPCKNIHGHSYEFLVTLVGKPLNDEKSPKNGMLMDFGDLKKMVKKEIIDIFDHALVLSKESDAELIKTMKKHFANIQLVNYQPTSENMLIDFAQRLQKILPHKIKLHSLLLRETATSYAEWYADDNC